MREKQIISNDCVLEHTGVILSQSFGLENQLTLKEKCNDKRQLPQLCHFGTFNYQHFQVLLPSRIVNL